MSIWIHSGLKLDVTTGLLGPLITATTNPLTSGTEISTASWIKLFSPSKKQSSVVQVFAVLWKAYNPMWCGRMLFMCCHVGMSGCVLADQRAGACAITDCSISSTEYIIVKAALGGRVSLSWLEMYLRCVGTQQLIRFDSTNGSFLILFLSSRTRCWTSIVWRWNYRWVTCRERRKKRCFLLFVCSTGTIPGFSLTHLC